MTRGHDDPLYILPFDHRGSFEKGMFGWRGTLTLAETTIVEATKQIIYEGFKAAVAAGVPKENACILVDEQFGAAVLRDAAASGYTIAYPVEKAGQNEFDFEYGEDFPLYIEAVHPTFCKVSVKYNPEGDQALNRRQIKRLKLLSDYLHDKVFGRLMFELLVPAEETHLKKVNGDIDAYDLKIRTRLTINSIEELQDAHVEPDVWMIEGLSNREDCERIVAAARYGGRGKVSCLVSGRGEDDLTMREWLTIAAPVRGFIGFSLGHGFWEPLWRWRAKRDPRETAIDVIARRFQDFVHFFEEARRGSNE